MTSPDGVHERITPSMVSGYTRGRDTTIPRTTKARNHQGATRTPVSANPVPKAGMKIPAKTVSRKWHTPKAAYGFQVRAFTSNRSNARRTVGTPTILRITPQFSGGVLTYVAWHFMPDRPCNCLLVVWHIGFRHARKRATTNKSIPIVATFHTRERTSGTPRA